MSIYPLKYKRFGDHDLDLEVTFGQNQLNMKDLVVICINFQDNENIKKQVWQNQLECGQKNDSVTSFSRFCDLDLDFLKVIQIQCHFFLKVVSYSICFKL